MNVIYIVNNIPPLSLLDISSFVLALTGIIISVYLFWLEFQIKPSADRIVISKTAKENEYQINVYLANDGKRDIRKGKCWVVTDSGYYDLFFVELEHPNRSNEHTKKYFSIPAKREVPVRGYVKTINHKITIYFKSDGILKFKNYFWR